MYESFYGFREKPFNLTPDPKYLYLSARHSEAFAHLVFGHRERGGFVVITGEVGTGKTTLARSFLAKLGPETATAVVLYPALSAAELLRTIVQELRIPDPGPSLKDLVDALQACLLQARRDGREVVLLIDEAQDLSPEVLEQVRLLSNLETDTDKLIHIVLMGQSELLEMLARHELRQLAQRVTARYHLTALSEPETREYVRHRLEVAGGGGKVTFTDEALREVHRLAGGLPRVINLLCDRALLGGYARSQREIDAGLVREAAREALGTPRVAALPRPVHGLALGITAAATLGLVGWALTRGAPRALAPAPAPTSTSASPTPPATPLEPALLALPREASLQGATRAVAALWGPGPLEQTWLRTHLQQLRRLRLPAVLEVFHPARRETCYVALLRIDGATAEVSSGGAPLQVALDELDRLWTRQALLLWRDHDGLLPQGPAAIGAPATRAALERLGYPPQADPGGAVSRFQGDLGLTPDGVVGARTLLALYSLGRGGQPRLEGGTP